MRLPVLAFDSSAAHCEAALLLQDRILLRHEAMEKGQAERLLPMLEELLAEAGLGWGELKAVAVGTGPGNFTAALAAHARASKVAGVPFDFELLHDWEAIAETRWVPEKGRNRISAMVEGRPDWVISRQRRGCSKPEGPWDPG